MKEMSGKMNDVDLIHALRRMAPETGSFHCLGCGYEHKCTLKGCAIIRLAAGRLEELAPPALDAPLSIGQLRTMDGKPVWVIQNNGAMGWCLVHLCGEAPGHVKCENLGKSLSLDGFLCGSISPEGWRAYRRKPEISVQAVPLHDPAWAEHFRARFERTE